MPRDESDRLRSAGAQAAAVLDVSDAEAMRLWDEAGAAMEAYARHVAEKGLEPTAVLGQMAVLHTIVWMQDFAPYLRPVTDE